MKENPADGWWTEQDARLRIQQAQVKNEQRRTDDVPAGTRAPGEHGAVWWIVCLLLGGYALAMLGIAVCVIVTDMIRLLYPVVEWSEAPEWLLFVLLSLLPALAFAVPLMVERLRKRLLRKGWWIASGVISVLLIPAALVGLLFVGLASPIVSQTEDPAHYRQFDDEAYMAFRLQELFPEAVAGTDAVYFYRDETAAYYEVYAAWKLPPEELAAEAARVEALAADWSEPPEQRGDFRLYRDCHMDWGSLEQRVFACNTETGEVRYAVCDLWEGDVPFWAGVAW